EIARLRRLDAVLLERWVRHLLEAGKNSRDPFYAWAKVACADDGQGSKQPWLDRLKPGHQRPGGADAAPAEVEGVLDYGKMSPDAWLPDDVTFGPGPVRPGEVRFSTDPAKPILAIADYAAAEKDPTWDGLKLAAGVEQEPGAMGSVVRAGR